MEVEVYFGNSTKVNYESHESNCFFHESKKQYFMEVKLAYCAETFMEVNRTYFHGIKNTSMLPWTFLFKAGSRPLCR